MDNYQVKLTARARRDLDGIYAYIAGTLFEPGTAIQMIEALEEGIVSLESMPYRCPERKRGIYANQGYRQLFVKNYTIIYRVDEVSKSVIVVTIRYSASDF
ncbi:MAG: type II toxin-antitoxin system RelE/ParE family toxin [Oscillospiraceae bacterium]|nr:type II toxin-antitoxin system RelE/ParE family toxin [Oscillospiraceae bacterium]